MLDDLDEKLRGVKLRRDVARFKHARHRSSPLAEHHPHARMPWERSCSSTARSRRRISPFDVRAMDVDFFVASGHKMCGPTGIGFLYGKARLARRDAAVPNGWRHDPRGRIRDGRRSTSLPWKFEAGTSNIADAIGARRRRSIISKADRHGLGCGSRTVALTGLRARAPRSRSIARGLDDLRPARTDAHETFGRDLVQFRRHPRARSRVDPRYSTACASAPAITARCR